MHTSNKDAVSYFTGQLGVNWYIDFSGDYSTVPAGVNKPPHISLSSSSSETCASRIAAMTQRPPSGSYWYVGGEPNTSPTSISGAAFAPIFKQCYDTIKAYDSTAKIMSPSILNWWWECTGCGGYTIGRQWMDDFRNAYKAANSDAEPPVDVWNIDIYPIDWYRTPNTDSDLAIGQIQGGRLPCKDRYPYVEGQRKYSDTSPYVDNQDCLNHQPLKQGMRAYLDAIPAYQNTPIWVTEIALHWGYQGWQFRTPFDANNPIAPTGTYCEKQVASYLQNVVNWFKSNGPTNKVERWFPFVTYAELVNPNIPGYAGISLFNSSGIGASLSKMGQIYKDLAHGSTISIDMNSLPSCP